MVGLSAREVVCLSGRVAETSSLNASHTHRLVAPVYVKTEGHLALWLLTTRLWKDQNVSAIEARFRRKQQPRYFRQ